MNPMTIAGGLFGSCPDRGCALALTKDGPQPVVHNGVVVSSTNSKLVMTDEDGMESFAHGHNQYRRDARRHAL
jgi:hypothetical protein